MRDMSIPISSDACGAFAVKGVRKHMRYGDN